MTILPFSSTSLPSRTKSYARLPSTLIALTEEGIWVISPVSFAISASICEAVMACADAVNTASPSASSVWVAAPSRMVARYCLSLPEMNCRSFVPPSTPSTNRPVAIGSRVPAWPIFLVPKMPRSLATTSWLVHPGCLSISTSEAGITLPRSLACRMGRHRQQVQRSSQSSQALRLDALPLLEGQPWLQR